MKNFKNFVWIILIFAFCLRLAGLNRIFISSDETNIILASIDLFHIFDSFNIQNMIVHLLRFFAFPWGYVTLLVSFLNIAFLSILHIPLTELSIRFPIVVLGVLSCFFLYKIGKEIYSEKAGLLSMLFLAVLPVHIEYSRALFSNIIVSSFLLLGIILFFFRYFVLQERKWGVIGSLFLGLYLGSDNQFLLIIPLILGMGIFYSQGSIKKRFQQTVSKLLRWQIIAIPVLLFLPLFISWFYFVIKGNYTYGFIGHLFDKQKDIGLHLGIFRYVLRNCGWIVAVLFIPALFYGLYRTIRLRKEGLLFLWSAIYLLPWLFIIKPLSGAQGNRAYYISWIPPLLVIIAFLMIKFIPKKLFLLITGLIIILTLIIGLKQPTLLEEVFLSRIDNSKRYTNYGIKTAGYYIRENIDPAKSIFSDMGVMVIKYYLHRKVLNDPRLFWTITSSSDEEKYNYFDKVKDKVDLLLVRHKNQKLAESYIKDVFYRIVDIYTDNKPVLHIYSKKNKLLQIMDTEKYDHLFDSKYGNFKSLYVDKYFDPQDL